MADPLFTEFEEGERAALLQARSFVIDAALRLKGKRLIDEIDVYLATRLHDIRSDAGRRRTDG